MNIPSFRILNKYDYIQTVNFLHQSLISKGRDQLRRIIEIYESNSNIDPIEIIEVHFEAIRPSVERLNKVFGSSIKQIKIMAYIQSIDDVVINALVKEFGIARAGLKKPYELKDLDLIEKVFNHVDKVFKANGIDGELAARIIAKENQVGKQLTYIDDPVEILQTFGSYEGSCKGFDYWKKFEKQIKKVELHQVKKAKQNDE